MTSYEDKVDQLRQQLLGAARNLRAGFADGGLEAPPIRELAVLTCMDARIDPRRLFGLELGEAHIMRNAGARATDDVLRSLALSHHLMDVSAVAVVGHTECGLLGTSNEALHGHLRERGTEPGELDFLPFGDLEQSVQEAVSTIRRSPLLPPDYVALGFVYDVRDGALRAVPSRTVIPELG